MAQYDTDAIVIGAGAVGLACAFALTRKGLETVVLEAEAQIGQGVSARNSEVIHGGLYYPSGSLKSRLCVLGKQALYAYLEAHHIEHKRCGKLVVAQDEAEIARLKAIGAQGFANGVRDLRWLSGEEARAMEPELTAEAAIWSPSSGVFDTHGFMLSLAGDVTSGGGAIAINTPFVGAVPIKDGGFVVRTGGEAATEVTTRHLVIAAGLGAQDAAARVETYPAEAMPKLHYGKGHYFTMTGKAPFERLVYPMPIPGALGTHYRRDLGGQARFGPDLEFVDRPDYAVDAARAEAFYAAIRRFWPGLPDEALVPDYAGVRPKLHGPGEPQCDFRIDGPDKHGLKGLVALFGIESPGLTSSLAIGGEVARCLEL
ncbi:NAD(P)/FAD-dependent oxidoreductase [Maricaulis sp. CAU 1757]